jgi:hypothetical protein
VNILSTFLSRLAMYCDSLFLYSNLPLITVDGSDCTVVRDFAHAISVIAIVVGILFSGALVYDGKHLITDNLPYAICIITVVVLVSPFIPYAVVFGIPLLLLFTLCLIAFELAFGYNPLTTGKQTVDKTKSTQTSSCLKIESSDLVPLL